jgi:hypothetical protein
MQQECARMGMWMLDELRRFLSGELLRYFVIRNQLSQMA